MSQSKCPSGTSETRLIGNSDFGIRNSELRGRLCCEGDLIPPSLRRKIFFIKLQKDRGISDFINTVATEGQGLRTVTIIRHKNLNNQPFPLRKLQTQADCVLLKRKTLLQRQASAVLSFPKLWRWVKEQTSALRSLLLKADYIFLQSNA